MKRHGKRVKIGPKSYMNINGKGKISSFSSGTKGYRVTNYMSGAKRTTVNHGDGYYDSFYQGVNKPRRLKFSSSPTSNDGIEALFIIALIIFGAYKLSFFLLQVVLVLFIVSFPFTIFYIFLKSRYVNDYAPKIPEVFDDSEMFNHISELVCSVGENEDLLAATYAEGNENGVRLTKASDEKYFDTRSAIGSKLNANIDYLRGVNIILHKEIEDNRINVMRSIPNIQDGLEIWVVGRSRILAVRNSLYTLIISTFIGLCVVYYYSNSESLFSKIKLAYSDYSVNLASVLLGVTSAYIMFYLTYFYYRKVLWKLINHDRIQKWEALEGKWRSFASIDTIKMHIQHEIPDLNERD